MDDMKLAQAQFLLEHLRCRGFSVKLAPPGQFSVNYLGPDAQALLHSETCASLVAQKPAVMAVLKDERARRRAWSKHRNT